ncbi:MAG: hypothetical protein ACLUOL_03130 [Faecalibacterium sp.]
MTVGVTVGSACEEVLGGGIHSVRTMGVTVARMGARRAGPCRRCRRGRR